LLVQHDSRVLDSLDEISVPTLVLVGSDDQLFLPAADVMERRIPGARKRVLDGAGHMANADKPREFNAAVNDFLEGLP
jgi:pimeloyl-ACP methyl ester carboxylesterase